MPVCTAPLGVPSSEATGGESHVGSHPPRCPRSLDPAPATSTATLSRTSKDIKMERERVRQERLKQWGPRRQELEAERLAEERSRFFEEARQRFHSTNSHLFADFMAEQEHRFGERLGGRRGGARGAAASPAAFLPNPGDSQLTEAQLVGGGRTGEQLAGGGREEGRQEEPRLIPISISSQPASPVAPPPPPEAPREGGGERIIPVLVEASSSSSSSSSSPPSTPVRPPALPALMGDLRLGDSLLRSPSLPLLASPSLP